MAKVIKYAAKDALKVIDGPLRDELAIHRFNEKTHSKAQLFSVNGALGRQFGIVLGNTDVKTGEHPVQQTRILLAHCQVPELNGIKVTDEPYNGSRIKSGADSKIAAANQTSVLVEGEEALKNLLRWYAQL